jgi:hypothetical protein
MKCKSKGQKTIWRFFPSNSDKHENLSSSIQVDGTKVGIYTCVIIDDKNNTLIGKNVTVTKDPPILINVPTTATTKPIITEDPLPIIMINGETIEENLVFIRTDETLVMDCKTQNSNHKSFWRFFPKGSDSHQDFNGTIKVNGTNEGTYICIIVDYDEIIAERNVSVTKMNDPTIFINSEEFDEDFVSVDENEMMMIDCRSNNPTLKTLWIFFPKTTCDGVSEYQE